MPADAQICSCNNVTKGALGAAIAGGACTVADLKGCTKAGTSCGSCVPLLSQLLAAEGVELSKALCEHFSQSRAELFEIVQASSIRTFSGLIERYGTGNGSNLQAGGRLDPRVDQLDHILDGEQASLQDTNDHFLANLQRNGTYSVVPRVPGGDITPEQLILIGEIARDFGCTPRSPADSASTCSAPPSTSCRRFGPGRRGRHGIRSCLRQGAAHGEELRGHRLVPLRPTGFRTDGHRLELRYRGLRSPHKIKMGVSGCARECAEARGKDVGVIATESGWNLYVGGNGGMTPKHAQLLASDLDDKTLVRYIDRFLMYYIHADRLPRTAP